MKIFLVVAMIVLWTFNLIGVALSKEKDLGYCKAMYILLYVSFILTIVDNYLGG